MSFDVWAPGVMIRLSNFCICISSEEFTYFKHCPPPSFAFKKFQQKIYTESSVKGSSIYLCIIFIMRQIHLYFQHRENFSFDLILWRSKYPPPNICQIFRQLSGAMIRISNCEDRDAPANLDRTISITGNTESVALAQYLINMR